MQLASSPPVLEDVNPFGTSDALLYSNYSAFVDGRLIRMLDSKRPSAAARLAHRALRRFITSSYPCVGARSVFNRGTYRFGYYDAMGSAQSAAGIARDLCAFVMERREPGAFASFIAAFPDRGIDEDRFESDLWHTLQLLRQLDASNFAYSAKVSADPSDPKFAFSFCKAPFFVVGMHPHASRLSRRFAYPLLVFNPHDQFEKLRSEGRWERFKHVVRKSEQALQGDLNPNLSDYGTESEARQYSGKAADREWKCPIGRL